MHAATSINESDMEIQTPNRHLGSMKKLILFNNIRVRLMEQLCFLDIKTESHSYLINELCDFFRHRGLLELEHSRSLDKLLHCFQTGHTELPALNKPVHNTYACWHQLINETQSLSYDYATLSEIYNIDVIFKLQKVLEIYKKYRELVYETHEEISRILRNFYTTIRTYYVCQNDYKRSAAKLDAQSKLTQNVIRKEKLPINIKSILNEKQQEMYSNDKRETLKARNIYKHYTETASATIHKHMLRDLRDIIYAMDSGFCLMVSRAILAHVTSDQEQYQSKLHCFDESPHEVQLLDSRISRKKLLEKNYEDFLTRKSSKFRAQLNEGKNDTYIQNILHIEFELQKQLLTLKEDNLRKNLEKIYRALDMVEATFTEHMKSVVDNASQTDTSLKSVSTKSASVKQKDTKSKGYSQKKLSSRPKLFGGSLEEYIKITNEHIPLIMRSCIRVINMFGLRSHGIFRVSGSQVEILQFRDSFERGEDPLAGATDASDVNSVAGVLKLYLRELKEPLFPTKYFDIFISLIQMDSNYEIVSGMRNFFQNIPRSTTIVIRYLFSFLNHLSEFASENMMDAFNLAISFGPTLMPAPEDTKQVQHQTQLNELIKVVIAYHQEVFPKDLGGPQYIKCISEDMFDNDTSNTIEQLSDNCHVELNQSKDKTKHVNVGKGEECIQYGEHSSELSAC